MKKLLSTAFILIFFFAFVSEVFSTPPSVQSRYIAFSNITSNTASVQWTRGNGAGRIVVVHYGGTADWNDFLTNYLTPLDVSGDFSTLTDANGDLTAAYNDTDNRYQNSGNTYVVIDILTGTSRTSNFTNLVSGTTYNVRIFEYNISGTNADFNTNSATNNPRSFTTYNVTPPSGLSISAWSEGGKLSWTTDGTNAAGYLLTIKQGGTPVSGYENLDIGKPSTKSYEIMGLNNNTAYTYEIKSYDANNNLSNAATDGWITLTNPSLSACPPTSYSPGDGTIVGIGGTVTITLTATNNQVGLVENTTTTINGVNRTSFTDNGDGTYTVVYTVQSGNPDIDDGSDLPLYIDLKDGNGVAFATACTGTGNASNAPGIDANAPTVTNVTPWDGNNSSDGVLDGSYGIGCSIAFAVIFSENVTITGTPRIQLDNITNGGNPVTRYATYDATNTGNTTTRKIFVYTVQSGDESADLTINGGSSNGVLDLNGGTINDNANNVLTNTSLNRTGDNFKANNGIVVDGVRPTVSSIIRQTPSGSCTNVNTVTFRVTFSENIDNSSIATTDFTPVLVSGTGSPTVSAVTPVGTPPTNQYDIDVNVTSLTTAEVRLDFTGSVNDVVANCANASTATFATGQTYEIDHAAPTASIGGTSGLCYSTTPPTSVSGTASDVGCGGVQTVEVAIWVDLNNNGTLDGSDGYYDGSDWDNSITPITATGTTSWSWNLPSLPNSNARYYVQVRATDGAGNTSAWSSQTGWYFVVDNTAPVVSNISDGGITCAKSGDVVTITFDWTELNLGSNPTVGIYQSDGTTLIGNATYSSISGTAPNYTYTYTYTVGTGDYQNVQIKVNGSDCAGNAAATGTLTNAFNIDNTAPVVSNISDGGITCAKSGDVVTITFDWTELNLGSNPTVGIYQSDGTTLIGNATYSSISGTAPNYTYTYTYTVGTGDYQNVQIKVNGSDCAGNAAATGTLTNAFNIDNTAPVVNVSWPTNGAYSNGTQTVQFTVTETNPGTTEASFDNTNWTTVISGTTTMSAITGWSGLSEVTNQIYFRHTDCAGNVGTFGPISFTKDVTPPTITQFQMSCPPSTSGTIKFSEPVYANNNGTGNLTGANISVTSSGGSATINTSNISHTAGATTATVNITWTGTLNGFENVTVGTQSATSVYDAAGNAMAYPHTASDYANVEITIVTNPTDQTVCENTTANFSGSATGGAGLQYVWQYSTDGGNNFNDLYNGGTNPTISGATTTNLQLQNVPGSWNNYLFRLKAYNECDSNFTTAATLTVTPPTSITTQPQNTSICVGATASLSVTAQGGSLSYQWQYEQSPGNWVNVSDGTPTGADYTPNNGQSSTLQISGLASGSYNYRVIVYGSCSPTQVTSNTATVTVNALPTATISGDQTICAGSNATLTITLTGQSPWTVVVNNYGTISNITSSPYQFNDSPSSTTTYTITSVTDGNNCTNTGSGSATVTIQVPPTANAGANAATCVNTPYTVNDASASNYFSIQWTHNGNGTLSNSTTLSPTYTPAPGDAGNTLTLTLTANPNSPCTTPATSQKQLYIEPTPVVPTITKSPNVATVCEGTNVSATFSGGSGGNGQETYEYDYDNQDNWQTYTAGSNLSTTGHSVVKIRAKREASYCSSSEWVQVTWNIEPTPVAPTITPSPNSPTVCQGTSVSATFSGGSGGSGTNTYEYRVHDCSNWSSWATYNPGDNISTVGRCTVEVRAIRNGNSCSPVENTYTWVVNPSSLSVNCGSNSPVCEGGSLYLTASVSGGSGNYTYSWTGPNSFSSNDQNPTRSNMTTNDAGNYIVTVTDQNTGCVSSCTTAVTVLTNPSITTQPSDYKIVQGQSASPAFDPTTTNATSFQWFRDDDGTGYDGSAISGATSEDYSVNNAQFSQDGLYYLKASNNCDDVYSNYVRLKVAPTQASLGSANRTATTITLNWTRGNGDGVLLTVKQGTSNNDLPIDGTTYTASSNYNLAPEINGAGTAKIVYVGTGTSVTVTNLTNNTNYTFRAYEYKNALGIVYNTNTSGSNPKTFKTLPKEIAEENTTIGDIFAISIQPNPVTDESFAVKLYTDEVGLATVEIINELGETILSRNVEANVGINVIPMTMPIDNTKKGAGVYYLRVSHNGESLVQKFIYLP